MKAKDMAARYNAAPTIDTLLSIIHDCIKETKTIADARRVKSNSGMAAVLREVDDKYRAFARQCSDVNPDGFKLSVHKVSPASKLLLP
jgi:hypothetical protein